MSPRGRRVERRPRLPATAPLGYYQVGVSLKRQGEWKELASAAYRVAEYRPPEFLVDVTADDGMSEVYEQAFRRDAAAGDPLEAVGEAGLRPVNDPWFESV